MRTTLWLCAPLALFCACGSDTSGSEGAAGAGGAGGEGAMDAGGGGGGGGMAGVAEGCGPEQLALPKASTTYYFAVGEPGADNEACDGLAPTNEGEGHCPFKDLSSPARAAMLTGAVDVRFEFREGTYLVHGWDGLRISGAGASDSQPLVVSAYPGEHPIFDVPDPTGAGCGTDPMTHPDCVRQVIRVAGTYTHVQGITVQNGLAYDLEVTGGAHLAVRCNRFRYTGQFDMRSDQLKIDADAADVLVEHNEFTGWRSQAIDITEVSNLTIQHNEFHHPFDADGGATGAKYGARDVTIATTTCTISAAARRRRSSAWAARAPRTPTTSRPTASTSCTTASGTRPGSWRRS